MPKKDLTLIVSVLDRSGSMDQIIEDSIGGFNTFLKEQKELVVGEARMSIILFDDKYEELFHNEPINTIENLTKQIWSPRGTTALYDALGKTINSVGQELDKLSEEEKPEKILFVIVTDGRENSSKEFNKEKVMNLINEQRNTWKWEFLYFAADEKSLQDGKNIGIQNVRAYSTNDTKKLYSDFSQNVSCFRANGHL